MPVRQYSALKTCLSQAWGRKGLQEGRRNSFLLISRQAKAAWPRNEEQNLVNIIDEQLERHMHQHGTNRQHTNRGTTQSWSTGFAEVICNPVNYVLWRHHLPLGSAPEEAKSPSLKVLSRAPFFSKQGLRKSMSVTESLPCAFTHYHIWSMIKTILGENIGSCAAIQVLQLPFSQDGTRPFLFSDAQRQNLSSFHTHLLF